MFLDLCTYPRMDHSMILRFRPPEPSLLRQKTTSPAKHRYNHPISPRPQLTIIARKKPPIKGVSKELNRIASQNLDHAPARRRVRDAFIKTQQQLDHVLFKMAPTEITTQEWFERSTKGLEIFCKSWLPKPGSRIKAALLFCHGYGDTCTFFFEGIARYIAAAGYAVYAMDHPGFGLSDGLHGYIANFDELAENVIEHHIKFKARPEIAGLPTFVLGQSMGGAITLKAHLKAPNEWDGIILVAPMCKIAEDVKPPEPVLKLMIMLSKVIPTAKLFPQKDLAELAFRQSQKRELAVYNVICYDDLIRLRTAAELLRATSDIEMQLEKISSPLLILHGAQDRVTDPLVSKFLYEQASSKDKTLKLYEEGYHCILEGEPDERIYTVINDIISWLDARSSHS